MDIRLPGIHTERTATPRYVLWSEDRLGKIPGGVLVDGSDSGAPGNTGDVRTLRAGTIVGVHTGNLWRPSFYGATTEAYTSSDTHIHVAAATAVEIVRRQPAGTTLNITHAPTQGGTVVAYATLTYSAIDTATGIITCTNLAVAVCIGSLIGPPVADLSYVPRGILLDMYGVKCTDEDGNSIDVPGRQIAIGGMLNIAQVIDYPIAACTTHRTWLKGLASMKNFMWSDDYVL